jgi:methylenetetrahydrofolate reductase (NADPH)
VQSEMCADYNTTELRFVSATDASRASAGLRCCRGARVRMDSWRAQITGAATELLLAARHEIVPVRGAEAVFAHLPPASTVTITSSPRFGVDRTLEYAARLAERGFAAAPHLAARDIKDEAQLGRVLERLAQIGVREIFVIGGDGERPSGRYLSAIELVAAIADQPSAPVRIGVAAYPEGHPAISDDELIRALLRKQEHAHYMTSQICFDAEVLGRWLRRMRDAGVHLPLYIGLPGAVRRTKLLELSFQLGVGPSMRFLSKQRGLMSGLARPGTYHPGAIVAGVSRWLTDPELAVVGFQIFTFNEVERTIAWERRVAAE